MSEQSTGSPKVSVLITSYNRAAYIGETIESVLKQTFTDYEIVISDNCSTDNTMEVLARYANNPRIRIHRNERNIGQFPNRNMCASLARGTYLKYLDSDDLIYPWGLELLVRMMDEHPEAGWGLCSLVQIAERPYPFLLNPREAYHYHYHVFGIFDKAPLSSIIRKSTFDKVGGFSDIRMAGDFDMWQKLAKRSPVLLMPDGIVWNRVHVGQEMSHFDKYVLQYEEVRIKYLSDPECPMDVSTRKQIIRDIKRKSLREVFTSLLRLRFGAAARKFRIFNFYFRQRIPN